MKNIKKAAAVIAAAVLCMSMSMSAFASSVTDPTIPGAEVDKDGNTLTIYSLYRGEGTDKDGNKFTAYANDISEEVEEILKDGDKVKEILSDAGYDVTGDQNVVVLGAADFELIGEYDSEAGQFTKVDMPEGGVDLEITIPAISANGIEEGDTLYILHQKADGTWEVLEGEAIVETHTFGYGNGDVTYETYKVKAHFDSLSPVAVVKVMSNGDVVVLDEKEEVIDNVDISEIVKPNTDSTDEEDSNVVTDNKDNTAVTDKEEQNDEISSDKETTNQEEIEETKEETKEETVEGQKAQTEKSSSAVKTSSTVKKSPKTGNF